MHDARRDPDYLADICEAMRRITQYTAEMTYEGFLHETIVQDAVVRNLTIIGEATKRLSPDFRRTHPEIPWRNMAGMRDRLTHDYFGINYDIVWTVAHDEVPVLLARLCRLASPPQEPGDEPD
jgi:uncharacterized protein with HEPN domain